MLVKTAYFPLGLIVFLSLFFSGCKLFPFLKELPFEIKAVIEGEIKGHKVRCEKMLDLADGKWAVMCSLGNDMDVKYRIRNINNGLAQIEFVVGKSKEGREKIIATPTVLVKRSQSAQTTVSNEKSSITVLAERIQ